jgi:hypothetical protein
VLQHPMLASWHCVEQQHMAQLQNQHASSLQNQIPAEPARHLALHALCRVLLASVAHAFTNS